MKFFKKFMINLIKRIKKIKNNFLEGKQYFLPTIHVKWLRPGLGEIRKEQIGSFLVGVESRR